MSGSEIRNGDRQGSPEIGASPEGRYASLDDRCVFELTGPDRFRYLNGQVTNEVNGDLGTHTRAACVCSLKGKVEFLVWIRSDGNSIWIDGQIEQREGLHARLDRYLIADDCALHDRTSEGRLLHHFLPGMPGTTSERTSRPGKDLWLPAGQPNPFSPDRQISAEEFALLQLKRGVPRYPTEITGNEFPAELGIESWTVDFHKGCYLGQEVISRIESVGKIKRRLSLVSAKTPFDQNSDLRNEEGESFRPTGPSRQFSEEDHRGFAWGKGGPKSSQTFDFELLANAEITSSKSKDE